MKTCFRTPHELLLDEMQRRSCPPTATPKPHYLAWAKLLYNTVMKKPVASIPLKIRDGMSEGLLIMQMEAVLFLSGNAKIKMIPSMEFVCGKVEAVTWIYPTEIMTGSDPVAELNGQMHLLYALLKKKCLMVHERGIVFGRPRFEVGKLDESLKCPRFIVNVTIPYFLHSK